MLVCASVSVRMRQKQCLQKIGWKGSVERRRVENIAETAGNVEVWSSTENTVKQNEVEVEQSHTDIILTHFICSVYSREREGFSSNCPLATRSVQWVPLSGPAYHNQQKILKIRSVCYSENTTYSTTYCSVLRWRGLRQKRWTMPKLF